MNEELRNLSEVILKFSNDITNILNEFVIALPKIELPKFDLPNVDFKRIKSITEDNSKYGWTLTGEMGIGDYLNDDLLYMSLAKKDEYFYTYYSEDDWKYLRESQKEILQYVEPKWYEIIEECFKSFYNNKFKIIIPTLISIIEGDISFFLRSEQIGYKLISKLESKTIDDDDKFKKIAIFSLYHFLSKELFSSHKFGENRKELINRNWILHGRDDPKYWGKVDALRLINVLSSVQFVKRYLNI